MSFRALRRTTKAISIEAAKDLLENEKRAILAVNGDDGYPFAIPVNYYYDREEEKIYFHGAKEGHKVDSLKKSDKVCFTVYGNEHYVENDWAPFVQSTVVFGRCHLIESTPDNMRKLIDVAKRYYPSETEIAQEMAADGKAVQMYEIMIEHMCGKQIQEK